MSRSLLSLAFVAALVRPARAHDCPCERPQQDDEQQTVQVVVPSWQRVSESVVQVEISIPVWQQVPPTPSATSPSYASMQDIYVSSDGVITIVMGEATPSFLIDRVLDEKGIQNEWLAPLTCTELDRVEDALYARHLVDFEDDADEAFFAAATVGVYRSVPNLTHEGAEHFFSSQDKLTQLRVNRAQASANCSN